MTVRRPTLSRAGEKEGRMQPAGRRIGWLSIILALSALALLASLRNNDEPSTLLEWWKPTVGAHSSTGPSSADADGASQARGRVSTSGREPLTLKNVPSGHSELEVTDDETSRTLNHIRHKVSARETQLDEEDDHFSEGELASRLGRAIDAHEKCRRHWPHLESLESAQEIRVVSFPCRLWEDELQTFSKLCVYLLYGRKRIVCVCVCVSICVCVCECECVKYIFMGISMSLSF